MLNTHYSNINDKNNKTSYLKSCNIETVISDINNDDEYIKINYRIIFQSDGILINHYFIDELHFLDFIAEYDDFASKIEKNGFAFNIKDDNDDSRYNIKIKYSNCKDVVNQLQNLINEFLDNNKFQINENDFFSISYEGDFDAIIKNPSELTLNGEDDNEYIENGEYEHLSHYLDIDMYFTLNRLVGEVHIKGYLEGSDNDYTFTITEMKASPEKRGFGKLALKKLHKQFSEHHIDIDVVDEEDEAREFWDKMRELKYII